MKNNNISRRRFLGLTGKAVCAGIVAGTVPRIRASAGPQKVALIGYGRRGSDFWQQTILPHLAGKIQLSAIYEPNPVKQQEIQRNGEFQLIQKVEEIAATPGIDTVLIASPDNNHAPLIQKLSATKKRVVCEFPLAVSKEHYQQLSRLPGIVQRTVRPVQTERLRPVWQHVKTLLDQNTVSDVLAIDFHVYRSRTNTAQAFQDWQGRADVTGSWLIHEGTAHFDLVNWWLDRSPVAVSATDKTCLAISEQNMPGSKSCNWDSYSVQVKYDDNIFLNYSLNGAMAYDGCRLVVNGVEGQIESWLFNQEQATRQGIRIWHSDGRRRQIWKKTTNAPEKLAVELWQHCAASDEKAFLTGLSANRIAIEATNSIIQHQPVQLARNS